MATKHKEPVGVQEFLRFKAHDKRVREDAPQIDWSERKHQWLKSIAAFHTIVRKWMQPLVAEGSVQFLSSFVTRTEEKIGAYQVEVLTILIGKQKVELPPKER